MTHYDGMVESALRSDIEELKCEIEQLRKVIWREYRHKAARIKCSAAKVLLEAGDSDFAIWEHRCAIDETWMGEAADDTSLSKQESRDYRWTLEPKPEADEPEEK